MLGRLGRLRPPQQHRPVTCGIQIWQIRLQHTTTPVRIGPHKRPRHQTLRGALNAPIPSHSPGNPLDKIIAIKTHHRAPRPTPEFELQPRQ